MSLKSKNNKKMTDVEILTNLYTGWLVTINSEQIKSIVDGNNNLQLNYSNALKGAFNSNFTFAKFCKCIEAGFVNYCTRSLSQRDEMSSLLSNKKAFKIMKNEEFDDKIEKLSTISTAFTFTQIERNTPINSKTTNQFDNAAKAQAHTLDDFTHILFSPNLNPTLKSTPYELIEKNNIPQDEIAKYTDIMNNSMRKIDELLPLPDMNNTFSM